MATKEAKASDRTVEVLAAIDANTPGAFIPGQRVSFTGKLATQVAYLKGQGYQSIELAEVMASLREDSPVKKPSHKLRLEHPRSVFDFPARLKPKSRMAPPRLRAVFHINVDRSFTKDELKNFVRWIHSLSPSVGLSLEGVYEINSMSLVFQAPYAVYSKLDGIPDIYLICEATKGNCLKEIAAPAALANPFRDPNIAHTPSGAENIRPRK